MRGMAHRVLMTVLLAAFAIAGCSGGSSNSASNSSTAVPADIQGVMNESLYDGAQWGLQVIDSSDGRVLIDLNSNYRRLGTQAFFGWRIARSGRPGPSLQHSGLLQRID